MAATKTRGKSSSKSSRKSGGSSGKKSSKKSSSRKYGPKAQSSVEREMKKYKHGTLRSGKGGKGGKVTSRKQAIAIGLSEAREEGDKVPPRKSSSRSGKKSKKS